MGWGRGVWGSCTPYYYHQPAVQTLDTHPSRVIINARTYSLGDFKMSELGAIIAYIAIIIGFVAFIYDISHD